VNARAGAQSNGAARRSSRASQNAACASRSAALAKRVWSTCSWVLSAGLGPALESTSIARVGAPPASTETVSCSPGTRLMTAPGAPSPHQSPGASRALADGTGALSGFLFRVEQQVRDGGFACVTGDPGAGKCAALRVLAERIDGIKNARRRPHEAPQQQRRLLPRAPSEASAG